MRAYLFRCDLCRLSHPLTIPAVWASIHRQRKRTVTRSPLSFSPCPVPSQTWQSFQALIAPPPLRDAMSE